jgi:hypothetical protein
LKMRLPILISPADFVFIGSNHYHLNTGPG